ncbi:MAG: alpha-E domain-containing protein, partial [Thauera sp.]|nr:alpha-E domain-containing protein [Thauera sp.]
ARLGREALRRLGGLVAPDQPGPAPSANAEPWATPTLAALGDLCRRCGLLPLVGEAVAPPMDGVQELSCALFDAGRSGSVVANLRMVLRLAAQLRDRLSPDSWRIYNRLTEFAEPAEGVPALGEAMHRLDESLLSLVTLSGFVIESMPRDVGWRFLSIGRRIERLQFLAAALAALLAVPHRGALEALLAVTDGEIRYRSRNTRGLAARPVAELVLFDGDNPRALRYQLDSLVEHVARLPDGAGLGAPLQGLIEELEAAGACDCLGAFGVECASPGAGADCETIAALLARTWSAGNLLADAISQRYFTHLDARSRATASR